MPRFFFDFFDGEEWSKDDRGLELASVEAAYLEAFAGARGMLAELSDGHRDPSLCAFEVTQQDRLLFRLEFSELLGSRQNVALRDLPTMAVLRSIEDTHRKALAARSDLKSTFEEARRSIDEAKALIGQLAALNVSRPAGVCRR